MAKFTAQMTIPQFERMFPTDDACKEYLVSRRWPQGIRCPRCGNADVYPVANKPFHWQCSKCTKAGGYRFSVLVGTIFENTNVGMRAWFRVIHMMLTAKKGVSALQIQRTMGFGSYATALYMCHRVRGGLVDPDFRKLMGIVEVDETYVGGKDYNRHFDKKSGSRGRDPKTKTPIVGAVRRKGNVVARVVENVKRATLEQFVNETISTRVSLLCTDDFPGYNRLHYRFKHGVVDHSDGEHVVGAVHANTIEGFWSLVKRGIVGTFHKVSKKYLPLYVAEFEALIALAVDMPLRRREGLGAVA